MTAILAWLEASALGEALRNAGVWSYALINLAHIAGVATLFGSILILDLKLLGLFSRAPLAAISVPTVPLAAAGMSLALVSGAHAPSSRQRLQLAAAGGISLAAWITAVTAGRLIGYW